MRWEAVRLSASDTAAVVCSAAGDGGWLRRWPARRGVRRSEARLRGGGVAGSWRGRGAGSWLPPWRQGDRLDWQASEHEAKWLDRSKHEADGGVGQDLALLRRLMAEGEVARDHLQQQLIDGVEQAGAAAGGGVGDVDVGLDSLDPSHAGG